MTIQAYLPVAKIHCSPLNAVGEYGALCEFSDSQDFKTVSIGTIEQYNSITGSDGELLYENFVMMREDGKTECHTYARKIVQNMADFEISCHVFGDGFDPVNVDMILVELFRLVESKLITADRAKSYYYSICPNNYNIIPKPPIEVW